MNMVKILALGNEFILEDSFAKDISKVISEKCKKDTINIKDSFQLLDVLQNAKENNEEIIIIDVVQEFKRLHMLSPEDLQENNTISAHDLDASFFLQLLKPDFKIIGLPQNPKKEEIPEIIEEVIRLIEEF